MAESSSLQPEYSKLPDTPPVTVVSSASSSSAQQPKLQLCDIVMKGGITSGIVYPPAVSQLVAGNYQFQNIGGTSVGAMAAAGIAAAEFNRRCNSGSRAGFEYLHEDIQQWLGEDRNLLNLFQPASSTRPLFEILLALMSAPNSVGSLPGRGPVGNNVKSSLSTDPLPGSDPTGGDPKPPVGEGQDAGPLPGGDSTGGVIERAGGAANTTEGKGGVANVARMGQVLGKIGASWLVNYGPFSVSAVLGAVIGVVVFELIPLALFALIDLANHGVALLLGGLFGVLYIVLGLVGLWLGWHVGNVLAAVFALPENEYGLCSGHNTRWQQKPNMLASLFLWLWPAPPPPLTDWFSGVLNRLAGKQPADPPLTFGDLQGQGVQLKMISSNLSHNLPRSEEHTSELQSQSNL